MCLASCTSGAGQAHTGGTTSGKLESRGMTVWVSLLRGVNVGGRNRVSMPLLRTALTDAGFSPVRTYVQSGNVITGSAYGEAAQVADAVAGVLRNRFDVDVPVVVRSPEQLREVLRWCPFPEDVAARPAAVHVVHLMGEPAASAVAEVLAQDWSPEALAVRGTELVIRYAETMHASRLQYAALLRRLDTDGTARNWRTLQALVDLTADA